MSLRICVICSGNICRSPMAEVVLRDQLRQAGLAGQVQVDSAGIGDWHIGERMDSRAGKALSHCGYDGSAHRARQFEPEWFEERDLILAADRGHVQSLRAMVPRSELMDRVRLMREFDPAAVAAGTLELDDPYYGDSKGFARVLREIETASAGVVDYVVGLLSPNGASA